MTFAQVVGGLPIDRNKSAVPQVVLNSNTYMNEWLKKSLLIGEAHSLDHIGTIHAMGILNDETKYLGGLRLAIHFGCSKDADVYLENKKHWKDWFKWIVRADQQELNYERMVWLKILGVPLNLWDEQNFSLIVSKFGRVISPFDNIANRRDYSMGKVGVITSNRKWINEELMINSNGVEYKVGVVEYTDEWTPFKPLPFDKVEDSDDDEEDVEGISETWMEEENDEPEEGEIRPEKDETRPEATQVEMQDKSPATSGPVPTIVGNEAVANEKPFSVAKKGINESQLPDAVVTNEIPNIPFLDKRNIETTQSISVDPNPSNNTSFIGPVEKLVPSGCFGPFPTTNVAFSFTSQQAHAIDRTTEEGSISGGHKQKKRKRDKSVLLSHISDQNSIPNSNFTLLALKLNQPVLGNQSKTMNEMLNHSTCVVNHASASDVGIVSELEETAAVGAAIGFLVNERDSTLAEVVGE
ncbi:unnamed protein product [Lactuca virosa]|uniref:DUF4283 domain-containing protein n=1 Tax=Lactuca virosa TaxID=75947 RepID=A0AAU9NH52_9ASTR|nr:unnamed protein product [Lactuca virosa]